MERGDASSNDEFLGTTRIGGAGFLVAHARLAYRDTADTGHDLPLRQIAVAHHAQQPGFGLEIGILVQELGNLRFDRLRQQGARPVAQHISE